MKKDAMPYTLYTVCPLPKSCYNPCELIDTGIWNSLYEFDSTIVHYISTLIPPSLITFIPSYLEPSAWFSWSCFSLLTRILNLNRERKENFHS